MEIPGQPSVLVVDDTEQNRYVVSHILRRAGFAIKECATGSAALESAGLLPDAIVLDVKLPDLSGYEVCRRLKADAKTAAIPIVLISAAFDPRKEADEMEWAGADDYLPQPVNPGELVTKIKRLIDRRHTRSA